MNNEASLGCRLTRPQFLSPWPFPFSCGHLLAICPPLPHIKQWTHVQLLAKQSWNLFDLNLLPSFGKLCLLVLLSNFISFAWSWGLFSCFCIVFNNSVSASSPHALLLLGSLNKFSSHSSGTDLLKFYMFTLPFLFTFDILLKRWESAEDVWPTAKIRSSSDVAGFLTSDFISDNMLSLLKPV